MTLKEAYQKTIQIGKSDMQKTSEQKYRDMFDAPYDPKLKNETHFKTEGHVQQLDMLI